MNTPSIAIKVKSVKFSYDRSNPREVYEAIKQFYPQLSAKEFTPEIIENFIPEGACPPHRPYDLLVPDPGPVALECDQSGYFRFVHR